MPPASKSLRRARICLFAFTCFASLAFSGAPFGWGLMQIMLEENGNFGHLCADHNEGSSAAATEEEACQRQKSSLLLVSTVTSFLFVTAPIWGYVIDNYGPFFGMVISSGFLWIGLSCLAMVAFLPGVVDPLLFLAFTCLMFVTAMANTLFVHVGLVFDTPESTQLVISVLNTLFDAGTLTYLVLYQMTLSSTANNSTGWVFVGYLGLAVIVYGGVVLSWQRVLKEEARELSTTTGGEKVTVAKEASTRRDSSDNIIGPDNKVQSQGEELHLENGHVASTMEEKEIVSKSDAGDQDEFQDNELHLDDTPALAITGEENDTVVKEAATGHDDESAENEFLENGPSALKTAACRDDVPISDLPPASQLRTRMFVLHAAFHGIVAARATFVLATAESFLVNLGDDDYLYLKIFTLLQPASIVGLPLINWIVNTRGYHAALQIINVLGALHGIIQVSTTNLNVQVLGFVIFSLYRSWVFSVSFGFLPAYLGMTSIGRGAGILTLSQGVMCALNIPLASIAINRLDGNFFWPNLVYTLVAIPCMALAWFIGKDMRRNQDAKDNEKERGTKY